MAQKLCPNCEGRTTVTVKRSTGPGEYDWDYADVPCTECGGRGVVEVKKAKSWEEMGYTSPTRYAVLDPTSIVNEE